MPSKRPTYADLLRRIEALEATVERLARMIPPSRAIPFDVPRPERPLPGWPTPGKDTWPSQPTFPSWPGPDEDPMRPTLFSVVDGN